MDTELGPESQRICLLKATKTEIVLSYSWCLGHFIKHLRYRADYFSGNNERRKAESTVSCYQLFPERLLQIYVCVRARDN